MKIDIFPNNILLKKLTVNVIVSFLYFFVKYKIFMILYEGRKYSEDANRRPECFIYKNNKRNNICV